ncbi:MAG TPA: NlpC/P60 family protein, partial [Brevibacterium sp.]|nr:NlpC/P60 family protein [Brevibacterium sp.]
MADPDPELAEVRERVDALHEEVARAAEDYNAAADERAEVEQRLERAENQVERQQKRVDEATQSVGSFAAATYRSGGMDVSLTALAAPNPDEVIDRASMLDAYTHQQSNHLTALAGERRALSDAEAVVADDAVRLDEIATSREDTKAEIESKLAEAEGLLETLEEEERERLEAERRAEEERERERREAEDRASRDDSSTEDDTSDESDSEDDADGSEDSGDADGSEDSGDADNSEDSGDDSGDTDDSDDTDDSEDSGDSGNDGGDASSDKAQVAIDFALSQVGKPYGYGQSGPDAYDCSGLTSAAWGEAGVSLPRSSGAQIGAGTRVSRSELQPGDLVFFYSPISHVGIYLGDGELVHASRPGEPVNVASMDTMPFS